MRLVHEPAGGDDGDREAESDGSSRTLATNVETADSFVARARGLMFRRGVPEDFALVFRFDGVATRRVHMLFVAMPLDVLWVANGTVRRVERLHPWRGFAGAPADLLVELPAGGADGVAVGDAVRVERS